jgi:tRNA (mo5U34)-methyltransferase
LNRLATPEEALAFVERHSFVWHQRLELAAGVWSPGAHDIGHLLSRFGLPSDTVRGLTVLDIGTTNGATAFLLERCGAAKVVAVDIVDDEWFGFAALRDFYGSQAEFVRASVYELPDLLGETFDLVVFLGVLYHLRHPLLAVDMVRALGHGRVIVESAVCDAEQPALAGRSATAFYRRDELGGDSSNWFAPTVRTLRDWFESSGFEVVGAQQWPEDAPLRASLDCRVSAGPPEFRATSNEQFLQVTTELTQN